MGGDDGAVLWNRWIDLWSGNMGLAESIIHPEFEIHRMISSTCSNTWV